MRDDKTIDSGNKWARMYKEGLLDITDKKVQSKLSVEDLIAIGDSMGIALNKED